MGKTFSISMCPGWNMSKAPSIYTIRAFGGAEMPSENCTILREVGMNLERVVWVDEGSKPSALASVVPKTSPSSTRDITLSKLARSLKRLASSRFSCAKKCPLIEIHQLSDD